MRVRLWVAVLWLMNLADAVSTDLALRSGKGRELNPLIAWGYEKGRAQFYLLKMGICTGALAFVWFRRERGSPSVKTMLRVLCYLYGALMVWHAIVWTFLVK